MASLAQLVEHQIVVLGVAGSIPVTRPIRSEEVLMSSFCYEDMVQDALLSVVRRSLTEAVVNGLSGDHHFYISFKTQFPGIVIPYYLVERHPDEMMIVIQYQYENLQVNNDNFSVSLSFGGHYERLVIPFDAIVAFVDPSVKFGLQFTTRLNKTSPNTPSDKKIDATDCKIIDFNNFKKK